MRPLNSSRRVARNDRLFTGLLSERREEENREIRYQRGNRESTDRVAGWVESVVRAFSQYEWGGGGATGLPHLGV